MDQAPGTPAPSGARRLAEARAEAYRQQAELMRAKAAAAPLDMRRRIYAEAAERFEALAVGGDAVAFGERRSFRDGG